jgi:NitT/TauT family transport system permease protein
MPMTRTFAAGSSTFTAGQLRRHHQRLRLTRLAGTAIALVLLFACWHVLALYNRPWVPSIADTILSMETALSSSLLYQDILTTGARLLIAFLVATVLGISIGVFIGFNRKAEAFAAPLLAMALAVPDPVYVIFSSLALSTGELAGFVALVLAVLPFVINIVRTGIQARDRSLDEMAKIYHVPAHQAFRHSIIPQLVPSLLTATRFSFALSWKIVILVEALTRPDGIGARIYNYFQILRMRDAIAQAILFCILMQLVEWLIFVPLERRLLRWRA